MRRHSTGQLTEERKKKQDERYLQNHRYDYLFIGTGMSALACASLLANQGYKVCMLEAHDIPGGYAHTFEMEGYYFCAQVHYIWGCQKGGAINKWLTKLGLEKEITFELYDPDGYDHVTLPDGKRAKIPYGFDNLIHNIDSLYPGEIDNLRKFAATIRQLRDEMEALPHKMSIFKLACNAMSYLTLVRYRNKTLQDLFDECQLSKEAQAILCGNSGDFGAPPEELSVIVYTALMSGYNEGAFYPTKHYKFFIERIEKSISDSPDCHIYYETEVVDFTVDKNRIADVKTKEGKTFSAETIICNMDPQKASHMIGLHHFPKKQQKKLNYEYSPSSFMMYLGVKGLDLRDFGFGSHNTWNLMQWDMNKMWRELRSGNYENPWFFISTPSLHTKDRSTTPDGCEIMEVGAVATYESFKDLMEKSPSAYRKMKRELEQTLVSFIEERFIPNFKKHIAFKVSGTPTTNEDFCLAPKGNAYGSHMRPSNIGMHRLKANTPFKNFYWCNATSGYAGICGTVNTGVRLYEQLTEDIVLEEALTKSTAAP